MNLDRN